MRFQELQILVAQHKQSDFPQNKNYLPIHVGKALSTIDLHIQGDNTGDNISEQNPYFCELTAIYWAWKNLPKDTRYVGLCHYRRFFDFHKQSKPHFANHETHERELQHFNIDVPPYVIEALKNDKIILPKPHVHNLSSFLEYSMWHNGLDMKTLYEIVKQESPFYAPSFEKVIFKENIVYPFNMFIMPRHWFDSYCSWLFHILFELQKKIDISQYDNYQQRIFGFLSERMLAVFVDAHQLKTVSYPVVMFFPFQPQKQPSNPIIYAIKNLIRKKISKIVS